MTKEGFEVDAEVDVYAQDGATVIGRIRPGIPYQGERRDEHWLMMHHSGGEPGYVRVREVRLIAGEAPDPEPFADDRAQSVRTEVPRPQLPPTASTPSVLEPTAGPRLQRRSLLVGSVAVVAALAGGLFAVTRLGGQGGADEPASRAIVLDRPLAIDLGDAQEGYALALFDETDLGDELLCEPRPVSPDAAFYEGQFDRSDFFGGTVGATITCNNLSIEVVDGELSGLHGLFHVEDFRSELEVDDESRQVTDTLCRSDVYNYFELGEVTGAEAGAGATAVDLTVAIGVQQTLGEPEQADWSCDERLAGEYTKTWSAQVVYDDFTAIISFVDDFGEEIGSVLLGRRG